MASPPSVYAPCRVETKINDVPVCIEVATEYPFKETIRLEVAVETSLEFALHLRVPDWAQGAHLKVDGESAHPQPGGFCVIRREWSATTEIVLRLPLPVRVEERTNGAAALHRGPLLLALPVSEEWHALGSPYVGAESRAQEWEVWPQSVWNYALEIDGHDLASCKVEESAIGALPFDSRTPALRVAVAARRVPTWGVVNNSAAPPPLPARNDEPLEQITLVPYGNARLRIAEFAGVLKDT
jgi:DUF1680 family protein